MPRKKKETKPKLDIPTYTEEQIDNKEVDLSRGSSEEMKAIRKEVMDNLLQKPGSCILLNDVVKHYNRDENGKSLNKSNSELHTRLRNIFHKPYLGVRIVKKDGRLFILRIDPIKDARKTNA